MPRVHNRTQGKISKQSRKSFVFFSHPDYTVGTGILPQLFFFLFILRPHRFSRPKAGRGLYRRSGILPFTEVTLPRRISLCSSLLSYCGRRRLSRFMSGIFPSGYREKATGGCRTHLAFFPEASYVLCLRLGTAGGIRGRSGRPGTFVSSWERIGRLSLRLAESERRVQDDRRTSRPTGKSL